MVDKVAVYRTIIGQTKIPGGWESSPAGDLARENMERLASVLRHRIVALSASSESTPSTGPTPSAPPASPPPEEPARRLRNWDTDLRYERDDNRITPGLPLIGWHGLAPPR